MTILRDLLSMSFGTTTCVFYIVRDDVGNHTMDDLHNMVVDDGDSLLPSIVLYNIFLKAHTGR